MTIASGEFSAVVAPIPAPRARLHSSNQLRPLVRYSASPGLLWEHSHPLAFLRTLRTHWYLFCQLSRREILNRYQGSKLGLSWAALQPLLMLAVYFFVFRFILRAQLQSTAGESHLAFCLNLLTGLVVFSLGSEILQRSPGLVHAHPNLVKRVRFPLEILSPVALAASSFHLVLALVLVATLGACAMNLVSWHVCWLPLVLLPYVAFLLGCSWLLAAMGTFVRDLSHVVVPGCQALIFLTPVFYRLSDVPERFRPFVALSPFAVAVENTRRVVLGSQPPEWTGLLLSCLVAAVTMYVGHCVFLRAKRAFADVT